MNIAVTEALKIARGWQTSQTTINGSISTNGQELQIKFTGRVTVFNDGIVVTCERGCEVAITLLDEMATTYGAKVLEIRFSGYRCVLYEPLD